MAPPPTDVDESLLEMMQRENVISLANFLYKHITKYHLPMTELKMVIESSTVPSVQKHPLISYYKVKVAVEESNHALVKHLIRGSKFPKEFHRELRSIWDRNLYNEMQEMIGCPPSHVQSHRLRRKNPWPESIKDGLEKVKYGAAEKDRNILEQFYAKNPTPNEAQKKKLSKLTCLSVKQVTTWFKNRRHRHKESNEIESETTAIDSDFEEIKEEIEEEIETEIVYHQDFKQ